MSALIELKQQIGQLVFLIFLPSWKKLPSTDASIAYNLLTLFWRQVEADAMPYCIKKNISILAYSPLAQGLLTGKFERGHQLIQ